MGKRRMAWLAAAGALGALACEGVQGPRVAEQAEVDEEVTIAPAPRACDLVRPSRFEPIGDGRGGAIALIRAGARVLAVVADEDERSLHTVDAVSLEELSVTPLPGSPSQILPLADGRIAVALRDTNEVALYEPAAGDAFAFEPRCAVPVATEPVGLAARGDRLAVTSGFAGRLTLLALADLAVEREIEVPREPRAVVITADRERAFVSHLVGGRVSVVDLTLATAAPGEVAATEVEVAAPVEQKSRSIDLRVGERSAARRAPREANQGFALVEVTVAAGATRLLAPLISVDPGPVGAPVSSGYGGAESGARVVAPLVAVLDVEGETRITEGLATELSANQKSCLLPRAAVAHGTTVWLACLGLDAVLELDGRFADPIVAERRRFAVPAGPVGLAVDGERRALLVWSAFAHQIARVDLDAKPGASVARRTLAKRVDSAMTATLSRGRQIFHATRDVRSSRDGRACASCHPDGRDDGLVWTTPDGLRQTKTLAAGVAGSAPFGWFGEHQSLDEHLAETLDRLGGTGFAHAKDREDLAALIAYVDAIPRPVLSADPATHEVAERGREIFESAEQGCAGCHVRGGTDGLAYDVGSGVAGERRRLFDTPSLRLVGATAPYFHDGRYATLRELLVASDGWMGHGASLGPEDLMALETYLRAL